MKKLFNTLHNDLYVELIALSLLLMSIAFMPYQNFIDGYGKILCSSALLLTDFIYVGKEAAALFNVFTVLALNILIVKLLKIKISSPVFAGLLISAGFAFFGKTAVNVLPIYLGIFLFSRYKKTKLQSFIIILLFSSGLAPLVSYIATYEALELYISIPLGIICGVVAGFILPAFSAHTMQFHDGYNLFNTGFAIGIVAGIYNGLLSFMGISVSSTKQYDGTNYYFLYIFMFILSILFILIAVIFDRNVFKKYKALVKTTGRLVSYYIRDYSIEAVLLNFGILCICLSSIFLILDIPMNGIICGSILSIAGCASFGVHIRNIWPIWLGSIIAICVKLILAKDLYIVDGSIIFNFSVEKNLSIMVAFIFAGALAPISGKFGIGYGLFAGFLHIGFTPFVLGFHNGLDLYNNGFSAGFEAGLIHIMAEKIFNKEHKRARKS